MNVRPLLNSSLVYFIGLEFSRDYFIPARDPGSIARKPTLRSENFRLQSVV
jgi:hypothetical protein